MEEIIELTGSPETAYTTFLYVVENLFNWDENGRGKSTSVSCNANTAVLSIMKVISFKGKIGIFFSISQWALQLEL